MPNHVTTIIKVTGKDASKALKSVRKKYSEFNKYSKKVDKWTNYFDFEKIIPMPDHIFRGDLSFEDEIKYGAENCWYQWSIKNWGTKWNSYSHAKLSDRTVSFQTAWSLCDPALKQFSKMFPENKIHVWWADEDCGSNLGYRVYKAGSIEKVKPMRARYCEFNKNYARSIYRRAKK